MQAVPGRRSSDGAGGRGVGRASRARPARALQLLGVDPFSEAPFRPYLGRGAGAGARTLGTHRHRARRGAPEPRRRRRELGVGVSGDAWSCAGRAAPAGPCRGAHRARRGTKPAGARRPRRGRRGDRAGAARPAGPAVPRRPRGAGRARAESALAGARARRTPAGRARSCRPPRASEFVGQMTRAFDVNLTALSLLALVGGVFLVYNTMTFSVVQRRATLGMAARARRHPRRDLRGRARRGAPARARRDRARARPRRRPGPRAGAAGDADDQRPLLRRRRARPGGASGGAGEGSGSRHRGDPAGGHRSRGRGDGRAARRRDPARRAGGAGPARRRPRAAAAGLALLAAGALLSAARAGASPGATRGLFAIILGAALLTPLAMVGAATAAGPCSDALLGLLGRMAARGVVATLSRTGVAVAALMVAVAATVGVGRDDPELPRDRRALARGLAWSRTSTCPPRPSGEARGESRPWIRPSSRGSAGARRRRRRDLPGRARLVARTARPSWWRSASAPAATGSFGSWQDRPTPCGPPFRTERRRSCRSLTRTATASPSGACSGSAPTGRARLPDRRGVRGLRLGPGRGHDEPHDLRRLLERSGRSPRSGSCSRRASTPRGRSRRCASGRGESQDLLVRSNRALREASLEIFDRTFASPPCCAS